jgi:hypothetical protein
MAVELSEPVLVAIFSFLTAVIGYLEKSRRGNKSEKYKYLEKLIKSEDFREKFENVVKEVEKEIKSDKKLLKKDYENIAKKIVKLAEVIDDYR